MRFIIGENRILYGQDFNVFQGIPKGIYDVTILDKDKVKLIAPGFGKKGDYGNGAIYVTISKLPKEIQDRVRNEL